MASYSVELTRTAEKQLRRVAKRDRSRLLDPIEALGTKPRPQGARRLGHRKDIYR